MVSSGCVRLKLGAFPTTAFLSHNHFRLDPEDSLFASNEAMQMVQEMNSELGLMQSAQEAYKKERDKCETLLF